MESERNIQIDVVMEDFLGDYYLGIPEEVPQCECGETRIKRTKIDKNTTHYECTNCPNHWEDSVSLEDDIW